MHRTHFVIASCVYVLLDFGVSDVSAILQVQTYCTGFIHNLMLNELLNLSHKCAVVRGDVASIRINNCNMALTVNFVDKTPTHNTHLCSTVCPQARIAQLTRLAQGPARLWCDPCLIHCCSLTCLSPRARHLPHSLFLLPRHKNTQHNRNNTIDLQDTTRTS